VIVNFLGGAATTVTEAGAIPASTFEAAALMASAIAQGRSIPADPGLAGDPADDEAGAPIDAAANDHVRAAQEALEPGQTRIRGLYSGGSLAGEAKLIVKAMLGKETASVHEIIDLGDDEYTVGRPHPMIDPRLRNEYIGVVADEPSTAVILLDVVLGHGSSPDPAGALVTAIEAARSGRGIAVVASVCGTAADPQDLSAQEATLARAGVILATSNARAARIAAAIVAPAAVAAGSQP